MRYLRTVLNVLAMTMALMTAATPLARAQTYTILHSFSGGSEGSGPVASLTLDQGGNLYGVAQLGGSHCGDSGCGTVFQLFRHGSSWIVKKVYDFTGADDGAFPDSRVLFGLNGSLYGTTSFAGPFNSGAIYKLRPPATICQRVSCPWIETTLYNFTGGADGGTPQGDITIDQAGNLYGTTFFGGTGSCQSGCGVVWELSPTQGTWSYSVLHSFASLEDGAVPYGGLYIDHDGNIFGTTAGGGAFFDGTVFELVKNGSTWTKTTLYEFQGGSDGAQPQGGLTPDADGNLYGFTFAGGDQGNGTAYRLHPTSGGWEYSRLLTFPLHSGPVGNPLLDGAGNIYGSAYAGGVNRRGAIFKLAAGTWSYTSLHDCTIADGDDPLGTLIFDSSGNVLGTTASGGANRAGVVFQIAP